MFQQAKRVFNRCVGIAEPISSSVRPLTIMYYIPMVTLRTLVEREFIHEMATSFADKPTVLGQIELSDRPRNGRRGAFILGVLAGVFGFYLFLRIAKWISPGTSEGPPTRECAEA